MFVIKLNVNIVNLSTKGDKNMSHREKHNIESNCVSFNDDCYNETKSLVDNVQPKAIFTDVASSVYKTGQSFINYLETKLSINKDKNDKGEINQ